MAGSVKRLKLQVVERRNSHPGILRSAEFPFPGGRRMRAILQIHTRGTRARPAYVSVNESRPSNLEVPGVMVDVMPAVMVGVMPDRIG